MFLSLVQGVFFPMVWVPPWYNHTHQAFCQVHVLDLLQWGTALFARWAPVIWHLLHYVLRHFPASRNPRCNHAISRLASSDCPIYLLQWELFSPGKLSPRRPPSSPCQEAVPCASKLGGKSFSRREESEDTRWDKKGTQSINSENLSTYFRGNQDVTQRGRKQFIS